jgi:hypothetical protein
MQIINNLSEYDMLRSMKIPHTPWLLAGAFLCLVEACDHFATEAVNPLLHSFNGWTSGGRYSPVLSPSNLRQRAR